MESREISKAVIARLPRYYRYLGDLLGAGIERISSNALSKKMNVTASQIRQDLNNFGGFGQQGYGYNVEYLHTEIGKILGLDEEHPMIIIGAGNLGQAIANYPSFSRSGFSIKAIFDIDEKYRDVFIGDIPVYMMEELEAFVDDHPILIAALAVPRSAAADTTKKLVNLGIKGIWNFVNMDLDLPEDVIVENVHLSDSLMILSYNINCSQPKK